MKTGAVISAAGHSSREAVFQPMLSVGGTTVIRRIIITLKQAGVEPIVVITGQDGGRLEKHVAKMGVICLRNEAYETTKMFDSVEMGLRYIEGLCQRVLILPVKNPLFLADTVERLLQTEGKAACPVYHGRRGHPVLISTELIPGILSYDGSQGLRGALRQPDIHPLVEELPVEDQGIIMPIESDEDWENRKESRITLHSVCRLYLEGEEIFFGPGIAQFLSLVDHTGSMQTACRQMHMSYSKGWKIVKDAQKQLGFPLLVTRSGGAEGGFSQLTPQCRDFLRRYLDMEAELSAESRRLFEKYFAGENDGRQERGGE